jgi:predicted amidohydrolase
MESSRRLASAQTVPVACDIDANLAQHLQLAETAAAEGVSLLVFPELSLTGYELAFASTVAFDAEDARLRPLVAAARTHEMTLVVGAPVRSASGLHIAAFIIQPGGGVQVYTKHHLGAFRPEDSPDGAVPPPEASFFSPGAMNPKVAWRGRTLAVSICADSAYPSHAQSAAERGSELYLSCQFAIPSHMAVKMSRLKDAARRHGFTVVFSNFGGTTGGLASGGGSCIRSADGHAVVRLPAEGCGLAIAWEDGMRWAGKTVSVSHA